MNRNRHPPGPSVPQPPDGSDAFRDGWREGWRYGYQQALDDQRRQGTAPSEVSELFSYSQAAAYLGVSERMLRRLKAAGEIKFIKLGHRTVRFKPMDLRAYLSHRDNGPH